MSNYRAGRDYEHEVAEMLRAHGYTVMRAAGSKGEYDLHARKVVQRGRRRDLWLALYVQAKARSR